MEMGSNDIMGEPAENTRAEGHEEAESDTATQRCMKTPFKDLILYRERSWGGTRDHRDEHILGIKCPTDALILLSF